MKAQAFVVKIAVFIVLTFLCVVQNAYTQDVVLESYKKGTEQMNKGLFIQALDEFNKVIAAKPDFANAYFARGAVYYAIFIGNPSQTTLLTNALDDFNKSLELNPNLASVYVARAAVYAASANVDKAIDDCTKAIETYPNMQPDPYAEAIMGKSPSKDEIERGIKSGLAEAYYNRGHFYALKMKLDNALSDLDKAIEYDPQNLKIREYREGLYKEMQPR